MANPPKKTEELNSSKKTTPTNPSQKDDSVKSPGNKKDESAKQGFASAKHVKPPAPFSGGGVKPSLGTKGIKPPPGIKGGPVPGFMKKEQAKNAAASRSKDPLAQAAIKRQSPQQVRIVLDDSKVSEEETGTKGFAKKYGVLIGGLFVGLLIGFTAGGTNVTNKLYNQTIRDGQKILEKVTSASGEIDKAVALIDQTLKASSGADGKSPVVDKEALDQLLDIKKPFSASDFSRKNYSNFKTKTVDALFVFNASIEQGWQKISKSVGVARLKKKEMDLGIEAFKNAKGTSMNQNNTKVDQNLFLYLNFQKDLLEAREALSLAKRVGEKLEKDLKVIADVNEAFSL